MALVGTATNVNNINRAGKTMLGAGLQSSREMGFFYNQLRRDHEPWIEAGQKAIGQLSDIYFNENGADYSSYFKSPDYNFALNEGLSSIENRASMRGLLSGRTMKEMTRYSQDHATKYYQNYVNNLGKISGQGLQAAGQFGQLGFNAKKAEWDYFMRGKEGLSASYLARGQALMDGAMAAAGSLDGTGGGGGGKSGGGFGGF